MKALTTLRRACATGRDAQTVTVRRGHLQWLLAEYERLAGVSVSPLVRAERGCMGCAHDGGGSDCDACDYPEWPHWEPRSAAADATPARTRRTEGSMLTHQEDRVLALRRRFHGAWVRMQRDAGKGVPAGAEWNAMRDEMHGAVLALADDSVRAVSEAWRAEHLERTGVASEDCDPRACPYGGES